MFQKLYIFLVLFVCMFSLTNAAFQKGTPYATLGECTSNKIKYDRQYSTYDRSNCYKDGGSYLYTLCGKGEGCADDSMSSGGPINTANSGGDVNDVVLAGEEQQYNIPDRYKKVLDLRLQQIGKKDLETLQEIESKISALIPKYRNSQLASDVLGYFLSKLHKIIEEKKIEAGSSDVDQLVCSLAGTCASKPPMIIDPIPPIVTPTITTPQEDLWPITDPYKLNSNKTAGPFKHPNGKDKVYIVDRGLGGGHVPSCMNGFTGADCNQKNMWTKGLRTNEVWSIRLRMPTTKENYIAPIPYFVDFKVHEAVFGLDKVYHPGAAYQISISKHSGQFGGKDFQGNCTYSVVAGSTGNIAIATPEYIEYLHDKGISTPSKKRCIIESGEKYFINFQILDKKCDLKENLCNRGINLQGMSQILGSNLNENSYIYSPDNQTILTFSTSTPNTGKTCTLKDNERLTHTGVSNRPYTLYREGSCSGVGSLTCVDGKISNGGFSPAEEPDPKKWYDSKSTCENESNSSANHSSWPITDPYKLNSNKTAGPFKHPNGKDKVFIVDRGPGATAYLPSCMNGYNGLDCNHKNMWTKGLKTDEIWSIRMRMPTDEENPNKRLGYPFFGSFQITPTVFGLIDVFNRGEPGGYEASISTMPGDMSGGSFNGRCTDTNTRRASGGFYIGDPNIITFSKNGESGTINSLPKYCILPVGSMYYINIRITNKDCDIDKNLCNIGVNGTNLISSSYLKNNWYNHNPSLSSSPSTEGNENITLPSTISTSNTGKTCTLKDNERLSHTGLSNRPYTLYREGSCSGVGSLTCVDGSISNGGFSPVEEPDPKKWYKERVSCLNSLVATSNKKIKIYDTWLGANKVTHYTYKIDYSDRSKMELEIWRKSKFLQPSTAQKKFTIDFAKLNVGKCIQPTALHGAGTIIGSGTKFQTFLRFCKKSNNQIEPKHIVRLKGEDGIYKSTGKVVSHGIINLD